MEQSTKVYTGLATVAFGAVLLVMTGRSANAVPPVGMSFFGCVQVFVGRVSELSVGGRTSTLRHLLTADSAVGGLLFGVVVSTLVATRSAHETSTAAGYVLVAFRLPFSAWMLYGPYQLLHGVTPPGYVEVDPNVDRELHV